MASGNSFNIDTLWLVVVRRDQGANTSHVWNAPGDDTGLRRIFRAAVPGAFPVAAVPITQVFATRLEKQPGMIQRIARGPWWVALVQGRGKHLEILQVQAKDEQSATQVLRNKGMDLRALLSHREVLAATSLASAILASDRQPDRDLVAHPPRHTPDPLPAELEQIEFRDRTDVWSRVRK